MHRNNNRESNFIPYIYSPVDIERVKERPEALRFISDTFAFIDRWCSSQLFFPILLPVALTPLDFSKDNQWVLLF